MPYKGELVFVNLLKSDRQQHYQCLKQVFKKSKLMVAGRERSSQIQIDKIDSKTVLLEQQGISQNRFKPLGAMGAAIALFVLLPPIGLLHYLQSFDFITKVLAGPTLLILLGACMRHRLQAGRLAAPAAAFGVFVAALIVGGLLHHSITNGLGWALLVVRVAAFALLLLLVSSSGKTVAFLRTMSAYSAGLLFCNIISQVVFPEGMIKAYGSVEIGWQPWYLLGNANTFVFYYIFFNAAIIIYRILSGEKLTGLIVCAFAAEFGSLYALGESGSTTGLLIVMLMVAIYILDALFGLFDSAAIPKALCLLTALALLVIVFLGRYDFAIVSFDLLGIDAETFIQRTVIWDNAKDVISENFLFGYGPSAYEFTVDAQGQTRSSHNTYLQVLYYSGIVGFVGFSALCTFPFIKTVERHRPSNCCCLFILMFLIAFMVEQQPFFPAFYYLIVLFTILEAAPSHTAASSSIDGREQS